MSLFSVFLSLAVVLIDYIKSIFLQLFHVQCSLREYIYKLKIFSWVPGENETLIGQQTTFNNLVGGMNLGIIHNYII